MITYIPYRHSIKAILIFSFLLQCCQPYSHAFEEAISSQEPSSGSGVQRRSFSEVTVDNPIVVPSAPSSDECILFAHRALVTADAPTRSTRSIFTASSGESVEFIRLGAQWHAVVLDDRTRTVPQQTLPVRSGDKDIDRLVTQLQLQDKRFAKARIHVLQKDYSPEHTACVYLGRLGLLGGMPKNKRQQGESTAERKSLRSAMQQSVNLSTEQEGEITAAKSDAILGRNGPTKEDRKGSFYELLIDVLWNDYISTPFAKKEDFVVTKVINPVLEKGGRFMRWDSDKGQYRVMGESERRDIVKTVMQALRDRRKNTPEKLKKRTAAQGIECTPLLRQEADCPEQDCEPLGMSPTVSPRGQKHVEEYGQQANCLEQNCEPPGVSTIALFHWQKHAEAPDQQDNCSEQDVKPPAIDSLYKKQQNIQDIIQPEQPMYTLRTKNLAPQSKDDVSQMGLSKREKSMANRRLMRAAQQLANLSAGQEGEITATKNDAILGHKGPTEGSRKGFFYEQLIDALWDDYSVVPLTQKEDFVVAKIINPVFEQGGRFIRWDADKQQYRAMEEEDIIKTVRQALRDRRKNALRRSGREECAHVQPLRQEANCPEQDCEPIGVFTVAFPHGQERGKSLDQQTNYSEQDLESFGVLTVRLSRVRERAAALYHRNKYLEQQLESRSLPAVKLSYFWKRAEALYQQAQCLEQQLESRSLSAVELLYWQEHAEALYQQANYPEQGLDPHSLSAVDLAYWQQCSEATNQQAIFLEQDSKLPAIDSLRGEKQDMIQPEQPTYTLQLRDSDAILGCNGPTKADRKGSFYEQLMRVLWDEYSKIPLTEKEGFVVNRVINPVRKQGGRFMRWDTNRQQYRVMGEGEEKEIAKTVMQSLRDHRKSSLIEHRKGAYAQSIECVLPLRQEANCPEQDLEPLGVSAPELTDGREEAESPDQQLNCPEQYLEPLGVSSDELSYGQKHAGAPEQQDSCSEPYL